MSTIGESINVAMHDVNAVKLTMMKGYATNEFYSKNIVDSAVKSGVYMRWVCVDIQYTLLNITLLAVRYWILRYWQYATEYYAIGSTLLNITLLAVRYWILRYW